MNTESRSPRTSPRGLRPLPSPSRQASDALAALEVIQRFYEVTGNKVSLLSVASEFVDASAKLNNHSIREAVDSFLRHNLGVQRKDIALAVEEFIAAEEPRTKAKKEGERPELSEKYAYNRAIILRRFSGAFPNTAVCDLAKEHITAFITGLDKLKSAKARNHKVATSAKRGASKRITCRRLIVSWKADR